MKIACLWNYFVLASFTVTALGGNLNVQAKSIDQAGGGKQVVRIAQGNPSGYSSGDSLAPPANQSIGNTSNTSGYSPGDTLGSSPSQAPGALRGCCPASMKLIQDCLYQQGAAGPGNPGSTQQTPIFPPKTDLNPQPLPPEQHPGTIPWIPWIPAVTMPRMTMMLYGDGVSTSKATLELTCDWQVTDIPLETICTSGKTKRPWPTKAEALHEHVQYQLGLTDPQLLNILQSANDQNAQGLYSKLAIAPARKLQTITQLATWMYEARVTGNPADLVTPQAVASDICQQSHTSLSSLSDSESKELTHNVMDMLMAADETEKHSHIVTWQPPTPPELPPPTESYQPNTPPSIGTPPLELICIPAGTRFITTDCRYQSCMVIRCAYGRCPGHTGGSTTTSGGNPSTSSGSNTLVPPSTDIIFVGGKHPLGGDRLHTQGGSSIGIPGTPFLTITWSRQALPAVAT